MATKSTFCRICEAHCGLKIDINEDGVLTKIHPDSDHLISQGFVCAKGLRFLEVADHPERLQHPLARQADGSFKQITWDEALDVVRERIRPLIDRYGVHAVGVYFGTPMIHNALGILTLFQWIRALGTRNVFSAGSQDNNSKLMAQKIIHGYEWIMPIADIAHSDFCLLMGTNPVVSQGTFIHVPKGMVTYDDFLKRGGKMVIVDPRESESARRWGGHIRIQPGTDIYLLLAILNELRGLLPASPPQGMEALLAVAEPYPAARASPLTGIPEKRIVELAAQIREARRATFLTAVGINQGPFGALCLIAIQAIAYLTGNFDVEGGLLFNGWSRLLQYLVGVKSQKSRIGGYLSHAGGMPCGILGDEILTEGDGQIKALIVVAGNPLTSAPDENKLRKAFESLDFMVSIDIFKNQTGELADMILPGSTWLERYDLAAWDAMYETAPLLQTASPVRKPPGDCRTEARILADLAIASGKPLFRSSFLARLWGHTDWDNALPKLVKPVQWLFRKRLQGTDGLPWPQPKPGLYRGRRQRRLRFWHESLNGEMDRLAQAASAPPGKADDFLLMGRRRRLGQNSWLHNAGREEKDSEAVAWLAPEDMVRLSLRDGDQVVVTSDVGEITLPVAANESLMPGSVIVPHGLPGVNVNKLISSDPRYIEPVSGMHRMVGHRVTIHKAEAPKLHDHFSGEAIQ